MFQITQATGIKEKTFAQLFRESLEEERKLKNKKQKRRKSMPQKEAEFTDDENTEIEPRNMTPKRTGNIAVTKHRNVSYEIKNGQPVFRLRRSPRKSLTNAYLKASHERSPITAAGSDRLTTLASKLTSESSTNSTSPTKRRSSKLFTPSGSTDYLVLSPKRTEKGFSRANIPSPIKFVADETISTEEKENSAVISIIDHLENTLATDDSVGEVPSQVSKKEICFKGRDLDVCVVAPLAEQISILPKILSPGNK